MNWASAELGATIQVVSSQVPGCEACNVLTDNLSEIWLSETGIPQWICISLTEIENLADAEVRTIGWYCWHAYSTNPREVRLHVSRDGAKYKVWDTVKGKLLLFI